MLRELILTLGGAAAVCAGLVFVLGAVGKLRHAAIFPGVVANYRLLPAAAVAPVAMVLPWAELAIGLALIAGERQVAPALAAALLLAFAAAMALNLRRGRNQIDCGCGTSTLRQPLRRALVVRNLLLATAVASVPLVGGEVLPAERLIALAAGATLFLLYLLVNALLALPGLSPQPA
jgi:hypothetical protein